jgi:glycosyltransferase involved in cell wall biosynthesis
VTPLGVSKPGKHFADTPTDLRHYKKTSWGYLEYPLELDSKVPFLLFVGGADKRRKLGDLITAFNNLRAQGHELKLILAGDSMRGPGNISTEEIQTALKDSSYLDDIIFMGFVNDIGRDWLYKNSLAFVFPSRYEGFGLPVLEAMIHDCPVISYENDAVKAVAEQAPLYTYGSRGIFESVKILLESTDGQLEAIRIKGRAQAKKFSWEKTSQYILSNMIDML